MLPNNDGILVQVADVYSSDSLWILFHDHPTEVGVEKAFSHRIRVFCRICISMMCPMISGPPSHGSFDSSATNSSKENP